MNRNAGHNRFAIAALAAGALLVAGAASAQVSAPPDPLTFSGPDPTVRFKDIAIEQHLDAQLSLDLAFVDEAGNDVTLGDYLTDRPAILALVYYECPMLCTLELNSVEAVVGAIKYRIGEDYDVITVSIDPGETPELAAQKKAAHMESLGMPAAEKGWHFLTGAPDNIDVLAETVGFGYAYDTVTDQYAHAAGIMILTPDGRVSRYYYGLDYIPRDVEFGLVDASKGAIGNLVDKVILLCYAYDPATGQYGIYVIGAMRILAVLTVLALVGFWVTSYMQAKRRQDETGVPPAAPATQTD